MIKVHFHWIGALVLCGLLLHTNIHTDTITNSYRCSAHGLTFHRVLRLRLSTQLTDQHLCIGFRCRPISADSSNFESCVLCKERHKKHGAFWIIICVVYDCCFIDVRSSSDDHRRYVLPTFLLIIHFFFFLMNLSTYIYKSSFYAYRFPLFPIHHPFHLHKLCVNRPHEIKFIPWWSICLMWLPLSKMRWCDKSNPWIWRERHDTRGRK